MPKRECVKAAQILWDYLKLDQPLTRCDCIIAMGSHDLRVAEYAAKLVLEGWAPLLICSGGFGRLTKNLWMKSEAEQFAEIALEADVPAEQILIEDQSTNTGENICISRDLLDKNNITIQKVLLVHKPYMERRALATALNFWARMEFCVSSPPISFQDYPNELISQEEFIQIMVGDFQRIQRYPQMGFQVVQDIPAETMTAFNNLVEAGFTKYIIQD